MYVNCVHSLVYVDDNYQISYGFIVLLEMTDNLSRAEFFFFFCSRTPHWFGKIPQNPHILAHANKELLNVRYPVLEICTWYLILDGYQYKPVAYGTVHCVI